ncbi:MAG: site-specific integrase [Acidobacteria bacterium]|nr:site-specific integrase [Acidobacteriota bacterium]
MPVARGLSLSEAVRGFIAFCSLERANTPSWIRFQERTLWEFLLFVEGAAASVEALQPFHLTDYLRMRQEKGDTASTRLRRAVIIRAMARWCEDQGRVAACPLARAKTPRAEWFQRELPPFEVMQALVRGCADGTARAAMELLLLTGLRRGELLALRWVDVDMARGLAQVRATTGYAPKSRRPRAVPLCLEAVGILRTRFACKVGPFLDRTGPAITPDRLTKSFKALAEAAHMGELRLHDLRHAFATRSLCDLRADVLTVQTVMGHSDVSVTRRYLHPRSESADTLRALMDAGKDEASNPLTSPETPRPPCGGLGASASGVKIQCQSSPKKGPCKHGPVFMSGGSSRSPDPLGSTIRPRSELDRGRTAWRAEPPPG